MASDFEQLKTMLDKLQMFNGDHYSVEPDDLIGNDKPNGTKLVLLRCLAGGVMFYFDESGALKDVMATAVEPNQFLAEIGPSLDDIIGSEIEL